MSDFGIHYQLLLQDVECFEPTKPALQLPVARIMWKIQSNFHKDIKQWIEHGGGHHTDVSFNLTVEQIETWVKMVGVEYRVMR